MSDGDRLLQERLGALVGGGREDWRDVRRRARAHGYRRGQRIWIGVALATAALAVAAAPPIGLGRTVLDLFRDPDTPALPRTFLSPYMRLSFDRKYGDWSLHEVANDGRTIFYALRDGDGDVVCIGNGRADGQSAGWPAPIGAMKCGDQLLSSDRPIYYDVTVEQTPESHGPRPWRVVGVAADSVEEILLTGTGERMEVDVEDNAFTITEFPKDAQTIKIAALDGDGNVLHREPLMGFGPAPDLPVTGRSGPPPPDPRDKPLVPRPGEQPLQRARVGDAELRVYRDGLVVFLIEPRSRAAGLATPSYSCFKYTEIDGKTYPVTVGGSGSLSPTGVYVKGRAIEPLVDPPYDGCEVHGDFGRHWNDPRGVRSPVEVALTARAKEFFNKRAGARDLAAFVRLPRIGRLRQELKENPNASLPAAETIRRGLPARVVVLSAPDALPGAGRIGIWASGRSLVLSSQTANGDRLVVELESGRITRHNLHDLARLR